MIKISIYLCLVLIHFAISPCFSYMPKANPKAIVQVTPNARFTVLTSRLIRMEWAFANQKTGNAEFNDNATFAFINRYVEDDEVPQYTVAHTEGNGVLLKTEYIKVTICIYNIHLCTYTQEWLANSIPVLTELTTKISRSQYSWISYCRFRRMMLHLIHCIVNGLSQEFLSYQKFILGQIFRKFFPTQTDQLSQ